jgi:hypothetical protein
MSPFKYENDKEINYPSLFKELIVNISYGDYFSSCRYNLFCDRVAEDVIKLMKKKITTEQELFIQVAAHGDAAAFFSMISPALRDYFLKLCSHGDSIEESAQKVYETAETLFKKLQHAHPDNFDHWIETEFSSLSHNGNSEHEVILDKNLFVQCEKVLKETQKVLFRVASSIKSKRQEKGMIVFFARHKIATALAIIAILVSIGSVILYGYFDFRLDLSVFTAKPNEKSKQNDSTTAVSLDSTKKADSIASPAVANTSVQDTKPTPIPTPPPKPRPRVTYTPPASENEGTGTYQSPRTSSYDQSQQPVQSRSERINQSSSYSSQNQTSENSATSSYYSSGSSTYSGQQSTQSQTQSNQEPNQP